jgi:hypothetical protein
MIFSPAQIVSHLSKEMTLMPGDIIRLRYFFGRFAHESRHRG